jgi:hypothetical protein
MSDTNSLYTELKGYWDEFEANHSKAGNKAAARRARSAINSIKKLTTSYKKASVEESK